MIAEDSRTLRDILESFLPEVGNTNLRFFENGAKAWHYLNTLADNKGEDFREYAHLLITDIEMPQTDGHHLTRRVKEHCYFKKTSCSYFFILDY